jgi:hypothetical protein
LATDLLNPAVEPVVSPMPSQNQADGIGIGLSSLQDPRKTQNELSRKVWQDPVKGRWMLGLLTAYAFGAMAAGLAGAYLADTTVVGQLSLGLLAFGLGMLGLLKMAIQMREHHRLDRNSTPDADASRRGVSVLALAGSTAVRPDRPGRQLSGNEDGPRPPRPAEPAHAQAAR